MSLKLLEQKLKTASDSEEFIIKKILENSDSIINNKITLSNLANECFVSHSTISRQLKKYGFDSWNAFGRSCTLESKIGDEVHKDNFIGIDIQTSIVQKWYAEEKQKGNFLETIACIKESEAVVLFGERISGNIAQNLLYLFYDIDINLTHDFFETAFIGNITEGKTVILMTSTAKTDHSRLITKIKNLGGKVVIWDSSGYKTRYEDADHVIYIPLVGDLKDGLQKRMVRTHALWKFGVLIMQEL